MVPKIADGLADVATKMTAGVMDRLEGAGKIRAAVDSIRGMEQCTALVGALLAVTGEDVCAAMNPNSWALTPTRDRARLVEQADRFLNAVRKVVGERAKAGV